MGTLPSSPLSSQTAPRAALRTIDVAHAIDAAGINRLTVLVVGLACLVTFCEGFDLTAISYVAPYVRDELHFDAAQLGNVFSASVLGMLVGSVIFCPLGDNWGRRPVIVVSALSSAVLSLAQMWAASCGYLLVVRFVLGLAIGAMGPLLSALVIEYAPSNARVTLVGVVILAYSLGAAASGPLTAIIAPVWGWRAVFLVSGILTLSMACAQALLLPESIRFLVGRGASRLRISQLLNRLSPATGATAADTFLLRDETPRCERRKVAVLLAGDLRFVTPLLWLACAASGLAIYFNASWSPIIYEGLSVDRETAALVSSAVSLAGATAGLALSWLTDRKGVLSIVVAPLCATPLLLAAGAANLSTGALLAVTFTASTLIVAGHFGILSVIGTYYPTFARAHGIAWATAIAKIGGIAGPALGGYVLGAGIPLTSTYTLLALCPLLVIFSVMMIARQAAAVQLQPQG